MTSFAAVLLFIAVLCFGLGLMRSMARGYARPFFGFLLGVSGLFVGWAAYMRSVGMNLDLTNIAIALVTVCGFYWLGRYCGNWIKAKVVEDRDGVTRQTFE